jgi:proteasome accessory factor C
MTRPGAEVRLARLLAMVPWIASHDGPAVTEVCQRFGVTERELLADLELLFLCGLYPFTPDTLIEVDVEDGRVWIRFAEFFRQPLRLTPLEGLALFSAGTALLALPGADPDGALARALEKLGSVLGVDAGETVEVELGPAPAGVLDAVRAATGEHRRLELEYYSFGRDAVATRVVEPWRVFNAQGNWYLSAWCQQAEGERLFRVDRIRRVVTLTETFEAPPERPAPPTYTGRPEDPVITLDLAPGARWVAERYPNEGIEERPDGGLRLILRVSERAWLERLLVSAGPEVVVVDGDDGMAAEAATRVLARYRAQDGSTRSVS